MKQLIFKGQYGWYIIANNYKDRNDMAYVNLYFYKGVEPTGNQGDKMWVDIHEAQFTCYKGKVGLTIFGWEETLSPKKQAEEDALKKTEERIESNKISLDDLPF